MSDPAGAALTALTAAAAAAKVKRAIACIVNGGDCNEIKMGSMVSKRMRENGRETKRKKGKKRKLGQVAEYKSLQGEKKEQTEKMIDVHTASVLRDREEGEEGTVHGDRR